MFLVFRFFLQMRPYFPTEVEGKGVSSKLMVMVGVYMSYKVLICRIQVIKQTYVTMSVSYTTLKTSANSSPSAANNYVIIYH